LWFSFHRQACLLGGQTTNRIFNYAADIPINRHDAQMKASWREAFDSIIKEAVQEIEKAKTESEQRQSS
jgi:hypothetical protein